MDAEPLFRVLIVEDDYTDREIYKRCLRLSRERRFEFAESGSAADGIQTARAWQPDCILLDYNLPDMDGLEVLNHLKNEEDSTYPFAVVMLTAYGDEALAVRAMKAGVLDYLPKRHANADFLPQAVNNAIEKFRMKREIEEQRGALERSARRYQVLLEAMPQMVWTADASGCVKYANRRWLEYTASRNDGVRRFGWDQSLHPEDCERTWHLWNESAKTGSHFEIEHRLKRASDGMYRWHLVRAVPIRSDGAEAPHWFGTCTDIEDQKQAEKAALERQKFESIGRLAGGIAHGFNNLLVAILGGMSLASDSLPPGHQARPLLYDAIHAAEQAAELTRRILAYAGKGNLFVESVNLARLVQETCERLRTSLQPGVHFQIRAGKDLPGVDTDVEQMRQVIKDVVTNAAEAIEPGAGGTILICIERVEIREADGSTRIPPEIHPGTYVSLEVTDNGPGMDEEMQAKIFDPFFSTKSIGRGLGLAAVQGFVRSCGGGIRVVSAPGKGTRVQVLLPGAVGGSCAQHMRA